ncbi:hypothetical protein TYRP_007820 [Tyrophagus putrescentiae]|nr:hypothetical protein TYRP_007820 [Tyrophagus putrescentiae]
MLELKLKLKIMMMMVVVRRRRNGMRKGCSGHVCDMARHCRDFVVVVVVVLCSCHFAFAIRQQQLEASWLAQQLRAAISVG